MKDGHDVQGGKTDDFAVPDGDEDWIAALGEVCQVRADGIGWRRKAQLVQQGCECGGVSRLREADFKYGVSRI